MRKIHLVPFALVGVFFLACASNPSSNNGATSPPATAVAVATAEEMTLTEFDQIQVGMTYEQVVALVGSHGEVQSDMQGAGMNLKSYKWSGPASIGTGFASIQFSDGKVSNKSQFGLK